MEKRRLKKIGLNMFKYKRLFIFKVIADCNYYHLFPKDEEITAGAYK